MQIYSNLHNVILVWFSVTADWYSHWHTQKTLLILPYNLQSCFIITVYSQAIGPEVWEDRFTQMDCCQDLLLSYADWSVWYTSHFHVKLFFCLCIIIVSQISQLHCGVVCGNAICSPCALDMHTVLTRSEYSTYSRCPVLGAGNCLKIMAVNDTTSTGSQTIYCISITRALLDSPLRNIFLLFLLSFALIF